MLRYFKFKEGVSHPIERHDDGNEVFAENVQVGASDSGRPQRWETVAFEGMSTSEQLKAIRAVELPMTSEEDRWREIKDKVPAGVFDMMHNEAVQRQIKAGVELSEKQDERTAPDASVNDRANETPGGFEVAEDAG